MAAPPPPNPEPPKATLPNHMKFILGGSAGMAAICIVQPLDLVKTRMQIAAITAGGKGGASPIQVIKNVIAKEGFMGLYSGIGAALLRQATYTTGRLGLYTNLTEKYKEMYGAQPALLYQMGMGTIAGGFGAFIGTPAEVALIRMTSDGRLPKEQRRNYTSVVNALSRISKEEGVGGLFRGCFPTIIRAMVVNMAQLVSYSQVKGYNVRTFGMKEGLKLHFVSAMVSGFITTFVSMPVDIVKTRIQNMKTVGGKPEYSGSFDVLRKILQKEGVFALWKGFLPSYCKIGPHTVFTFIFLEQFTSAYFKFVMGTSGGSNL